MLIANKSRATLGMILGVSFFGILALIFAPIYGGMDGLKYSDRLFNRLAKGSSYFVPELSHMIESFNQKELSVRIDMEKAEDAARAQKIFSKAAPDTTAQGAVLNVKGNLAKLLGAVLEDCNSMYLNKADEVMGRYGVDGKEVLLAWHRALNSMAKELQKSKDIPESKLILAVVTKGIEPAYNFYGVQPESINHRGGIVTFLLVFYLVYTLWYGFAIYFLFDGFGMAMTKARVKREV